MADFSRFKVHNPVSFFFSLIPFTFNGWREEIGRRLGARVTAGASRVDLVMVLECRVVVLALQFNLTNNSTRAIVNTPSVLICHYSLVHSGTRSELGILGSQLKHVRVGVIDRLLTTNGQKIVFAGNTFMLKLLILC